MVYTRKRKFGGSTAAVYSAKRSLSKAVAASRQLNAEFKREDFAVGQGVGATSTPDILLVENIAEGDEYFQRTGRSVRYVSSMLTLRLSIESSVLGASASVRVMIIRDKASNGVTPTVSQIFASTSVGSTAPLNPDYAGNRFEVITSERVELDVNGRSGYTIDAYRKLKNAHAVWSGTLGTIVNCVSGHLFLVMCRDIFGGDAEAGVRADGFHRIVYVDN